MMPASINTLRHCLLISLIMIFQLSFTSVGNTLPYYSVIDLSTPEESQSQAFSVNDFGHVVGVTRDSVSHENHAFLWNGINLQYIESAGKEIGAGLDINNNNQIAVAARDSGSLHYEPAIWKNSNITYIGTASPPTSINDLGQAVGQSIGKSGDSYNSGYLWDNGNLIEIKAETGLANPFDINNNSQIVGRMEIEPGVVHGFLWENGEIMNDFGTLGGDQSQANSVNDFGHAVGYSYLGEIPGSNKHAVLWKDSGIIDLGALDGKWSEAQAINNNGQIVGNTHSEEQPGVHVGFIWEEGTMYDLNKLLLPFENDIQVAYAVDINNKGQIVGWSHKDGNTDKALLLMPAYEVTTTKTYLTDYLTLGDTFTFDYWWEMGTEPTEFNFDVLFFNEENWKTFGWELNFDGSSDQWETASFWVPEWARGDNTRIMFSLFDWGQETDPTVYLRNIGSAQVPEPATIILLGTGLVGLTIGASGRKFRR